MRYGAIVAVGVATAIGVRAPGVAWCSEAYLAAHPEDMPLSSAPEICVEIASPSNALPKLREKAMAYIGAGAVEAMREAGLAFARNMQPTGS